LSDQNEQRRRDASAALHVPHSNVRQCPSISNTPQQAVLEALSDLAVFTTELYAATLDSLLRLLRTAASAVRWPRAPAAPWRC
jgi:hypothetical protein